jgi:hypothetical protein
MTNHTARLYALAATVLVFFVAWAAIAAHPWRTQQTAVQDTRLTALQAREQRLRAEALAVKRIVDKRWAVYRANLAARKRLIATAQAANARAASLASVRQATATAPSTAGSAAAAPSVRIVTLPPLTITRTS